MGLLKDKMAKLRSSSSTLGAKIVLTLDAQNAFKKVG
jgi:hypothetical protein